MKTEFKKLPTPKIVGYYSFLNGKVYKLKSSLIRAEKKLLERVEKNTMDIVEGVKETIRGLKAELQEARRTLFGFQRWVQIQNIKDCLRYIRRDTLVKQNLHNLNFNIFV